MANYKAHRVGGGMLDIYKDGKRISVDELISSLNEGEKLKPLANQSGHEEDGDKCVLVPVRELKKLEQARVSLYEHLSVHVGAQMLSNLTEQIWRVANTRNWSK